MSETVSEPLVVTTVPAVVPKRKCAFTDWVPGQLRDLLSGTPTNPTFRTMLHAICGHPIPETIVDYKSIVDWFEFNFEPSQLNTSFKINRSAPIPPDHQPARADTRSGLSLVVEATDTEYGTCHYSVERSGSQEYELSEDELREIVEEAIDDGDGIDSVAEKVRERMLEMAEEDGPDMDSGDNNYDYSEHNTNDHGNYYATCSLTLTKEALVDYMRLHMPEQLEGL